MGSHVLDTSLRVINISNPLNANISEKSNSFIFNNLSKDVNIENRSYVSAVQQ